MKKGDSEKIVGSLVNISQRERMEEALRESEERYRLLFNSGSDAVFVHQPTINGKPGKFIEVNDIACKRYGYSRVELLNLEPINLSAPEEASNVSVRVEKLHVERRILFETVHVTKSKSRIPVEISSHLFHFKEQPTILSIVRDISDRKQMEEALRERGETLKAILAASSVGIGLVQNQTLKWANKAMCHMLGYQENALFGESTHILYSDEKEFARVTETIYPGINETGIGSVETQWIKKDGNNIHCSLQASPLDPHDFDKGLIVAAMDISEQKKAEEHIHVLNQLLMKAQENERQMISRELHDSVGQDLSTLKIACDTLFEDLPAVPPKVKQRLTEMSKSLQKTIKTVRELAYDLRPPGLDQLGIAQTVFQYCEDFSKKTGLDVDFISAGLDRLKLDFETEINLYRLIQEGLNNIHKHADAGHAAIRLVASFPNIILRIEDDGRGFDLKERLKAIKGEKRMGLQSMAERVRLLGGKMRIQSRPNEGTKILVEISYKEKKSDPPEEYLDH